MRPKEFTIVKRQSPEAHFSINGNNGKIKKIDEITNPKAEHYIKVNSFDKKNSATVEEVEKVKELMKMLKFDFYSSVNGGVAWINSEDIYRAFNNKMLEM